MDSRRRHLLPWWPLSAVALTRLATSRVRTLRSNIGGRRDDWIGYRRSRPNRSTSSGRDRRNRRQQFGAGRQDDDQYNPDRLHKQRQPGRTRPCRQHQSAGGNVTGVSWFDAELGPKRLGLLHELVPNVTIVALLINPNNPESVRQPAELQEAVRVIGLQLVVLTAITQATSKPRSWQWCKIAVARSSSAAIRSCEFARTNRRAGSEHQFQRLPVVRWLGPMAS